MKELLLVDSNKVILRYYKSIHFPIREYRVQFIESSSTLSIKILFLSSLHYSIVQS